MPSYVPPVGTADVDFVDSSYTADTDGTVDVGFISQTFEFCTETCATDDVVTPVGPDRVSLDDGFTQDDVSLLVLKVPLAILDATIYDETVVGQLGRSINEALIFDDGLGLLDLLQENMTLADASSSQLALAILENINLTFAVQAQQVTILLEQLALDDVAVSQATVSNVISENATVGAVLLAAFNALVAENLTIDDAVAEVAQKGAQIVESLLLSGVVTQYHRAVNIVAEAMTLQAIAARYFENVVLDDVSLSAAVANLHRAYATALESAVFDDVPGANLRLMAAVSDTLATDDAVLVAQRLQQLVEEGFQFAGSLTLPDGQYTAYVVNSETLGLSEYDNFPFNSFALQGERYLGATETGIYELTGADDAGADIDAVLRTGLLSFGTSLKKRVPEAYIGYTTDGRLVLKASVTEGGVKVENWYELTASNAAPVTERIKIGKGLKARYWQFEITNADGSDFALDEVQLHRLILTRRI